MKLFLIACLAVMQLSTAGAQEVSLSPKVGSTAAPQTPPPRVVPNADDLLLPQETILNSDGTFSPKRDDSALAPKSPSQRSQDESPVPRAKLGSDTDLPQPKPSNSTEGRFPWTLVGIVAGVAGAAVVVSRRLRKPAIR
ncbi:MAG: hypothetical protein K8U03_22670 [Planctomycetia bacterium]|nr:hypothetical protein [Planctomycetia bacterium]